MRHETLYALGSVIDSLVDLLMCCGPLGGIIDARRDEITGKLQKLPSDKADTLQQNTARCFLLTDHALRIVVFRLAFDAVFGFLYRWHTSNKLACD